MSDDDTDLLATFEQAEKLNPWKLVQRYADSVIRLPVDVPAAHARTAGIPVREPVHDLDQLATAAALTHWLTRGLPSGVHRALRRGATVDQVAAAIGESRRGVARLWRDWAFGQRQLFAPKGTLGHLPSAPGVLQGLDEVEVLLCRQGLQPDNDDQEGAGE